MVDSRDRKKPILIKKYANRRLYDTGTSSYITLEGLAEMICDDIDFEVRDAKTGDDITRSILTQIIVEKEGEGGMLPISFLRQVISFYGNDMQSLLSKYLEFSMEQFNDRQKNYIEKASNMMPFNGIKEIQTYSKELGQKNIELFEQAMQAFIPYFMQGAVPESLENVKAKKIKALQDEIESINKQIEGLKS